MSSVDISMEEEWLGLNETWTESLLDNYPWDDGQFQPIEQTIKPRASEQTESASLGHLCPELARTFSTLDGFGMPDLDLNTHFDFDIDELLADLEAPERFPSGPIVNNAQRFPSGSVVNDPEAHLSSSAPTPPPHLPPQPRTSAPQQEYFFVNFGPSNIERCYSYMTDRYWLLDATFEETDAEHAEDSTHDEDGEIADENSQHDHGEHQMGDEGEGEGAQVCGGGEGGS